MHVKVYRNFYGLLRMKIFLVVLEEFSSPSKRNTYCSVTDEHRFEMERGKSPSPISPLTRKTKLEAHRCCMCESSPRFGARKSVRGLTILDCNLQLETQWLSLHHLKALNWIPTIGITPCLATRRLIN